MPNILPLEGVDEEENVEFHWGRKMTSQNKNVQFYESFTYDGVEYFLYDSVYVWCRDEPEPSIAKLVKMWETSEHKKMMKIVWYFRPCELKNFLRDVEPLEKEIVLACGEGKGLSNLNSPEAIAGKCKVVCTSRDERNPQVSKEELRMADQIFFRTFNVGTLKLSERFPDEIAGVKVVHLFNRENDPKPNRVDYNEKAGIIRLRLKGVTALGNSAKDGMPDIKQEPKIEEASLGKRTCFEDGNIVDRPNNAFREVSPGNGATLCNRDEGTSDMRPPKKRRLQFHSVVGNLEQSKGYHNYEKAGKEIDVYDSRKEEDSGFKTCGKLFEVTRRPEEESTKWFKQQPWKVKLQRADEKGALVSLHNLDPSYTSSEIEDIVWNALNEKVDAKMIQCNTFSSPHYGQALVVFRSKDAAETAISKLSKKCLVLTGGRPIVACRGCLKNPTEEAEFPGHLAIDRLRYQKQRDAMERAVSTSHCSQSNTIEHEMALEWRVLLEKSNMWWNAMNKQHKKEREELEKKLKISHNG